MDCFITTVDILIDDKPRTVCVIQETGDQKESLAVHRRDRGHHGRQLLAHPHHR